MQKEKGTFAQSKIFDMTNCQKVHIFKHSAGKSENGAISYKKNLGTGIALFFSYKTPLPKIL